MMGTAGRRVCGALLLLAVAPVTVTTVDPSPPELLRPEDDLGWATEILEEELLRRRLEEEEVAAVLGCTDPASRSFDAAATQDDGSCAPPGLACDELAATGCCKQQLEAILASPALGCRSQVLELHALAYALSCSVVGFGWSVPDAPVATEVANVTNFTDVCRLAGPFHGCDDGSCIPDDVPCASDPCWLLGAGVWGGVAFERCGDACVPIGYQKLCSQLQYKMLN